MSLYSSYTTFFDHCPVKVGDSIYLSSDLRKLIYQAKKHKETFSASAFVDGLKRQLTDAGTILVPAFNYDLEPGAAFDRQHTMPITGTLPAELLKDPAFTRTVNPMHSFMVWGHDRDTILAMKNTTSFGADSPFQYMYDRGVKLLGIDVDLQQSLTFAHYAEEAAHVKYRKQKTYTVQYTDGGSTQARQFSIYAKKPGYVNQVNPLKDDFVKAGILQEFQVNQVPCFLLDLRASLDLMKNDLLHHGAGKMTYFSWTVFLKSIARSVVKH